MVELRPQCLGTTTTSADYSAQEYLDLGSDPAARQTAHRELIREHLDEPQLTALRQHTQQQRAWGSHHFRQQRSKR